MCKNLDLKARKHGVHNWEENEHRDSKRSFFFIW